MLDGWNSNNFQPHKRGSHLSLGMRDVRRPSSALRLWRFVIWLYLFMLYLYVLYSIYVFVISDWSKRVLRCYRGICIRGYYKLFLYYMFVLKTSLGLLFSCRTNLKKKSFLCGLQCRNSAMTFDFDRHVIKPLKLQIWDK